MPATCASFGPSRRITSVAVMPRCVEGLQIDLDAAAVERGIGAVRADERGDAVHRRIGQQNLDQLLLLLGHGVEGNGGGGLRDSLDDAGVLGGEEPFGTIDVEHDRQHQGCRAPPAG